ncbi:MAG: hypothetical protein AB7P49_16825 [Bdellovibrionales bacterium]
MLLMVRALPAARGWAFFDPYFLACKCSAQVHLPVFLAYAPAFRHLDGFVMNSPL